MANVTVSSAVDTMLRSANNSAIRSNIQALSQGEIENEDFVFNGSIEFDGDCIVNSTLECSEIEAGGDCTFSESVTFEGSVEAEDETILNGFSSQNDSSVSGDLTVTGAISIEDDSNFTMGGSGNFSMQGGKIQGASVLNLSGTSQPSSPQNGMIFYNSSTNKFQGYANGAFVDLH